MTVEAEPTPYICKDCGLQFETREEVVTHWRANHGKRAQQRPPAQEPPPRSRGRPRKDGTTARPKPPPKRPAAKPPNEVQVGLTLAYGLAGQVFSMFGPDPPEARRAVGMSMSMTAVPAGSGIDKTLQRTPAYPLLQTVFGSTSVLTNLVPLGVPVLVGMYAYAPNEAKARLRPLTVSALGLILLQTFGPEVPPSPEELTPIAVPEWIRDLVNGLLPPVEGTPTTNSAR